MLPTTAHITLQFLSNQLSHCSGEIV